MTPLTRRAVAALLLLSLGAGSLAACDVRVRTGTTSTTSAPGGDGTLDESTIEWKDFGSGGRVQTGTLTVPLDHNDPSKGTIELFLARHLADPAERIGSLLVNPGGPGFGGSDYAVYAEQVYGTDLLQRFDIVGWDPRGTGLSDPAIDCVDDYDAWFAVGDITPDTDAERQQLVDLAKDFTGQCVERSGDFMTYMGTNQSARDMDAIRSALGEEKISYFGWSYGSELGAVWVTLFPQTVRAAVLDGATDPTADSLDRSLQQAAGFEKALNTFLADCSADDQCPFHNGGDAEGAFDTLMQRIDENPLPTVEGRPELSRGMALTAVAQAMYSTDLWPDLQSALSAGDEGDGAPLLALYDQYLQRREDGTWDDTLEAFQVISCQDTADRGTVEEEDALAERYREVAPRTAPGTSGSYFCTFFPPAIDPEIPVTGKGAGPILVMGTTGDPATPLEGTRKMAETLEDGRLVVVKAEGHTGYAIGKCSGKVIEAYLIDPAGKAPDDGTECR
ncbi:MAG: alpha/beta hydrolase [Acidobacteria bacterium]|nr:alpha/beta hydrolase [Acidobacteriota bacterium]